MSAVQNITVDTIDSGSRLDRWFKKRFPHVPHGKVEKLLRTGQLRVDGKRSKGNLRCRGWPSYPNSSITGPVQIEI